MGSRKVDDMRGSGSLGSGEFDTSPTQGWGKVGARLGQGLGQGPGKVRARSGQKARFGQGPGRQGLGKVRARLGQGLDKKQGSGKVGGID